MDTPHFYEIVVEGHLSGQWSDWFDGLNIQNLSTGETRMKGLLYDQAALYGVLFKIHDLNLVLVSVLRITNSSVADPQRQNGVFTERE